MKKTVFILIGALIYFQAAGPVFAQYISGSVPVEERVETIEVVEVKKAVNNAKDMIEKKGEDALPEVHKGSSRWLGPKSAIFVAEATIDSEAEGVFILYPDAGKVGKGAFQMSTVNGKHFTRQAMKKKDEKEHIWLGFIAEREGGFPHASAVALSPSGRYYAISATSKSLLREQHFLVSLVNAACEYIKDEGQKAFDTFRDKDSIFWLKGKPYIYVVGIDGEVLLDIAHPDYVGKNVNDYPQIVPGYKYPAFGANFTEALELAASNSYPETLDRYTKMKDGVLIKNGFAWVAYLTTKPGEEKLYRKVSYDKVVVGADGKQYVVGSGVYVYVDDLP